MFLTATETENIFYYEYAYNENQYFSYTCFNFGPSDLFIHFTINVDWF